MPIYTLQCCRCSHATEQGFTVSAFVAQKERGFTYITCPRCRRRGTMSHDFVADVKTQSSHSGEYTFAENAPEEHLVGQTVSKTEARKILKKHGLVESVREGKRKNSGQSRRYTEREIVERWDALRVSDDSPPEQPPEEPAPAPEAPPAAVASDKKSLDLLKIDNLSRKEEVDSDNMSKGSIAPTWPGLKRQARELGIAVPRTMKRPELEQLVRTTIAS